MNWPEGFGSLTRDGPCLTLTASSASSANLVHVRDMSSRMVWTRGLGACAAIRWHSVTLPPDTGWDRARADHLPPKWPMQY
jgi:hypothetical protein